MISLMRLLILKKVKRDKFLNELNKDLHSISDEKIKNKILYLIGEIDRLSEKSREYDQLVEVGNATKSVMKEDKLLNLVLDNIIEITKAERGFIYMNEKTM